MNGRHWIHYNGSIPAPTAYDDKITQQRIRMLEGPKLVGETLIAPSEWYDETARRFYKANGFTWCPGHDEGPAWTRNVNLPHTRDGKVYTGALWLTAVRQKYYEDFWPNVNYHPTDRLTKICYLCGDPFPATPHQVKCPSCNLITTKVAEVLALYHTKGAL